MYGFLSWLRCPYSVTLLPREITRNKPQFSDRTPTETNQSVATLEFRGPTFSLLKRSSFSAVGFLSFASSNFASREDIHFIPLLSDNSGIDAASGSFKKLKFPLVKSSPKLFGKKEHLKTLFLSFSLKLMKTPDGWQSHPHTLTPNLSPIILSALSQAS